MLLRDVASRSSSSRGRTLGLLGLLVVVAVIAAYLSDCLPGLGAGGSLGVPESESKDAEQKAVEKDDAAPGEARVRIVVDGDRCAVGSEPPTACPETCKAVGAGGTVEEIEIDATRGAHGTVETLKACLSDAGHTNVNVRSR